MTDRRCSPWAHMAGITSLLALMAVGPAMAADGVKPLLHSRILAHLPRPVTNNAVAALPIGGEVRIFSFNGLGAGKTYADRLASVWEVRPRDGSVRRLGRVPGGIGRLASTAAVAAGYIYLFGGYTVAADGAEHSTPDVFAFDPETGIFTPRAPMPVPVDDSVSLTYRDRFIYLVSGWHETGNVALVQVYDSREDRWFRASDYPGPPVFGHAGGIVGARMVIADGVQAITAANGSKHRFASSNAAYLGEIDANDPTVIDWRPLPPHAGAPLYRAAVGADETRGLIVFAGGGDNPYNYNAIGYDGQPSAPSDRVFAFELKSQSWVTLGRKTPATMDHRGLLRIGEDFCTLGGMGADGHVLSALACFRLP